MITQLCLAVGIAIFVSAMCSIFEAVLYSIPLSHIEILAKSGKKSGRVLKNLRSDIQKPITAILTLNTIANTMGAAVAGASAAMLLGEKSLALFSAMFTLSILLFSEILPKTAGVAYCRELAPWIALPVKWLVTILTPIIWISQSVTRLVPKHKKETLISAEEIQAFAAISRKSGEIDPEQEKVITNILELDNKSVRQVMTPRTVTFVMNEHLTVAEAQKMKQQWDSHSRVPVYDNDLDDIVGIVLRKDVLNSVADGREQQKLSVMMHPVHFVPEFAPLQRVMMEFFKFRQHLFVVVDEYGGFTGVISLEDIIEEIVGHEIMDESDQTKNMRQLARSKRKTLTRHLTPDS